MRRFRTPLIALIAILALGAGVMRFALADQTEGTMPNGWKIKPAGDQVDINRFPMGAALSPDGSKMIVTSDNGGMQGLPTVDTKTLQTPVTPPATVFTALAATTAGP